MVKKHKAHLKTKDMTKDAKFQLIINEFAAKYASCFDGSDIVNAKPDSARKQFDRLMEEIRTKACIDEEGLTYSALMKPFPS